MQTAECEAVNGPPQPEATRAPRWRGALFTLARVVVSALLIALLVHASNPRQILEDIRPGLSADASRWAMQVDRAQAIRELVVTVCHEFNNPLAAVKISFDLLQRQTLETSQPEVMKSFENHFNTIDSEIKRLRDLNFEKIDFHGNHSDSV